MAIVLDDTTAEQTLGLPADVAVRLRRVAARIDSDPVAVAIEGVQRFLDEIEDITALKASVRDDPPGTRITLAQLKSDLALED